VTSHMAESDIESGRVAFQDVIAQGQMLFTVMFNRFDGQGRPGTTGDAEPRPATFPAMARVAGPEAHSCSSCHNQPRTGGGGDFATNVFMMPDSVMPIKDSISPEFSNERRTMSIFGAGPIEMLAREMSFELRGIRNAAINRAFLSSTDVPAHLIAKGIDFGSIVAHRDGTLDATGVRGISPDLVVRPFHQDGEAVSIRHFTNDAMNQHLGIQSQERFGIDVDADGDGVINELTVGDMTAISLFLAQLATPGRVIPDDPARRQAVQDGEMIFNSIGCANCHTPSLKLNGALFTEPNPFNPEWKLPVTVATQVGFDMTVQGDQPRIESTGDGGAIVRAYTDLKRHNLCDDQDQFFCNEKVAQPGIALNTFLTRKLWDVGNGGPYGHRGDLSTLTDAIQHHAGEARPTQQNFVGLPPDRQAAVIEFLKSLQVLPPGSPRVVSEAGLRAQVRRGF
jgi:mono/diheme cytochrome c family protein